MSRAEPLVGRPKRPEVVPWLLSSAEPAVRLRVLTAVLDHPAHAPEVRALREAVRASPRVAALLSERAADGSIPHHPYRAKWCGAHWVLVALADLGYPAGDLALAPLREQVLGWLFSADYARLGGTVHGLPRLHASIDGNAVYALLELGLADERVDVLVERLLAAQWPDGGWNCDRRASGRCSSFTESLIPLRALALRARRGAEPRVVGAAGRAAEFFLRRRLFRRLRDGSVIAPAFLQLHYPCYWHYDILFALTVLTEAGLVGDSRTGAALDLLEAKRLPGGGFPAEHRYYRPTTRLVPSQRSLVDWGPTGTRRPNEFVTVRALAALRAVGRPVVGSQA